MKTAFAPKFLQFLLLPLFVFVLNVGWGQTAIFSEGCGAGTSGGTPVNTYTGWNVSSTTFSSSGTASDVRNTAASSGYTGSTGTGNVFMGTATVNTRDFLISGINTSSYTSISLSFGVLSSAANSMLTLEYSTDGTNFTALTVNSTITANTWTLKSATGTIPPTSNLRIKFSKSSAVSFRLDDIKMVGTATPTISTTGTLSATNTTYGTASASPTTFNVSGANMSAGILVTPPSGYEVSLTSGSGYASTVTVGAAGTIASTAVYVRLAAATAVGSYSGNIVLSSTSATSVNVATVSSAVSAKALTITGLSAANKNYDGNTTVSVTGTAAYSGLVNSESFPTVSTSGIVSWVFPSSSVGNYTLTQTNTYTAPSSNYSITQPSLTASINAIVPTAPTITGITAGSAQLSVVFTAPSSNGGASITNYEYSINNGSSFTAFSPAQTTTSLVISGLTNDITYNVQIRAVNSAGSGAASATVQGTPAAPSSPTISGAATASAFTTTYGTASTPQSFSITGSALTNAIIATAPTGFEVSSDGTVYGSTATFTQSGGSASGTLRIRLSATAAVSGTYNSQNIVLSSTGAFSVNIITAASGNTVSQKALAITAATIASKVYNRSTASGTVTPGTLSGFVGSETVVVSSAVGTYADWNVGTGKSATIVYTLVNGTNGGLATNYTLANTVGTGNITGKALTITSPAVTSKTYDGNTTATISGTLSVVESGDAVTLSGTGAFASANVGTGISVTSTSTLAGADAGNYSLTQPIGLTGNITGASQTITFASLTPATLSTADYSPGATASSGLTVTYNSSNPCVATIVAGNIHIVGIGTTTITASQSGGGNYSAATSVSQTLTVMNPTSTLAAGDVVVIAYNTGGAPDNFALLFNVDLAA
ncbi:MAG: beta strand repeat-containing protein, partial [Sediminibacterium sp.]